MDSDLNLAAALTSEHPRRKDKEKSNLDAPKTTTPCSECGKTFCSLKKLSGHMRCHPERQWRGLIPPLNLLPPNVYSGRDSWLGMTEEDNEAASCLLMLATGNQTKSFSSEEMGMGLSQVGHKCSICMRVFSSGRALGGHKRWHGEKGEGQPLLSPLASSST